MDFFHNQGIQTWIDDRHAIAHNKIIIIDRKTVITGSFNFSAAAEKAGVISTELQIDARATVTDAARAVCNRFEGLGELLDAGTAFAVNETYASGSTLLSDGDVVAWIPPVSEPAESPRM